jgi:hypothetical protein
LALRADAGDYHSPDFVAFDNPRGSVSAQCSRWIG